MKVLVTGGAGLIGSHIVDLLLQKGYEVRVLDNLQPPTHLKGKPGWIPDEVEFIQGDMRTRQDIDRALQGVEVVFHQAAFGGFAPEISRYVASNALGTAYLLELIILNRYPIRKIVVASSQAVYGEGKYECREHGVQHPPLRPQQQLQRGDWEVKCPPCGRDMRALPTDEETSIATTTVYGLTKFAQEHLVMNWGKQHGIPTVALRYSLTYGPRQSLTNPYTGVCSIFSTRILNSLPPVVFEDGNQTRDFVYVGDVAAANVFVMENDRVNDKVFNVGTGKPTRVLDFIATLTETYGRKASSLIRGEFRPGEVRHLFADNSRLSQLGFRPHTDLRTGLRRYVEWIQTQGEVGEYFTQAETQLRAMRTIISVVR